MTAKQVLEAWLNYFYKPQSPLPTSLFRIILGVLLLQSALIHVGPDVLLWYGPHGIISFDNLIKYWWQNQPHLDLQLLFPGTDAGTLIYWYSYVAALFMMTIGLCTRYAVFWAALCCISQHNHQPFNINGGDAMMQLYLTYLVFSDSGAALSVDRLITRFKNPTFGRDSEPRLIVPWSQRMVAIQLAIAYFSTFFHKIDGKQWLDGTAVYFSVRLDDLIRNQIPLLYNNIWVCKFLTFYTLVVEGALFSLVWIKDLRYLVLLSGIILHVGIDYSINLPVFEWAFMTGYICFLYPQDMTTAMNYIKARIELGFGPPALVQYAPEIPRMVSLASVLEGVDIFGRLKIEAKPGTEHGINSAGYVSQVYGWDMLAFLTARIPLLWPLFPLLGLPYLIACNVTKTKAKPAG